MSRPPRQSGAETRERILDVAEHHFARCGYRGATLRDIADAVNIRQPSLLYHFESKQVLFEAVMDRLYVEVNALIINSGQDQFDTVWEQMKHVISLWGEFIQSHPNYARIGLHNVASERDENRIYIQKAAPVVNFYGELLERGKQSGEFRQDVELTEFFALLAGFPYFCRMISAIDMFNLDPVPGDSEPGMVYIDDLIKLVSHLLLKDA